MTDHLKVLIVDDELHNRIMLEKMLRQHIDISTEISQAANVQEALLFISIHHPRIIFLDIQMQDETGFDLLQQLPEYDFEIIFVTAHDNYAIKAFRFNALDYLLKPVVVSELKEAVNKAILRLRKQSPSETENIQRLYQQLSGKPGLAESISVVTTDGFMVLPLKDIIYCQASSNYTNIYMKGGKKILSSKTLGYYEDILTGHHFFRAHRSYFINLAHVSSYKKGEGGFIIMSNGDEVELSRYNKNDFMELFKG
ncbi:MAG: LytTR family DNA-binding domain-containing protein [Ferruginibacter sp.]